MDERSKSERILQLAQQRGVLRPKDLLPLGIQAEYLRRLCERGELLKLGRGSYVAAGTAQGPALRLAVVARAVPNGVICLESALAFHGFGSVPGDTVCVAIERRAAKPRVDFPPLRITRLGGDSFRSGIETHRVEHVEVHLYSLEKTLADLFKFRNKIGPHVAVDALRAALARGGVDMKKLWQHARRDRVERVMRPYVDALLPH